MRAGQLEVTMERPQGIKRPASDDLERDQRLAKRFDLLNIEHKDRKLYVPVTATAPAPAPPALSNRDKARRNTPLPRRNEADMMQVEDTKHRVFIHDLDEELAGAESDEDNPIFLPDIEKHLLKLPKAVLINDEDKQKLENMQLVLYKVPTSLTLPQEHDNVRRIILEARKRIQDRQPFTIPDAPSEDESPSTSAERASSILDLHCSDSLDDPDAMEIG